MKGANVLFNCVASELQARQHIELRAGKEKCCDRNKWAGSRLSYMKTISTAWLSVGVV